MNRWLPVPEKTPDMRFSFISATPSVVRRRSDETIQMSYSTHAFVSNRGICGSRILNLRRGQQRSVRADSSTWVAQRAGGFAELGQHIAVRGV